MKKIVLGGEEKLVVPNIAVGCMRLNSLSENEVEKFIGTALELEMNFFDHADIYGKGTCEELFGRAIKYCKLKREDLILQSKCGIRPDVGTFDFSKEHILKSVDGSLKRLNTDYLDVLVLHRPDCLMEPQEVAEAFDRLYSAGKVKYFGVSNQNSYQIKLLQKYLSHKILVNQLQLSITNATLISNGIYVNMENEGAVNRDGSVLDYCRLNDITIQAWSPFQHGFFGGTFIGNSQFAKLNECLDEIAERYHVNSTTVALSWILRHPAKIQPVIGTMNFERLRDCAAASEIYLTREEWYKIFVTAGNFLP